MSYRAAIYCHPDCQTETVLTGPEQATWRDPDLIEEAMRVAVDAGLIGDDYPYVTADDFMESIYIGEWSD